MRLTVAIAIGLTLWAAVLIGLWVWAADTEETLSGQTEEIVQRPRFTASSAAPTETDWVGTDPATGDDPPQRETPIPLAGPRGLEQLVADTFPEDPETAARIVSCESGWNPAARSRTGDTGLFQINDIHRQPGGVAFGLTIEDLQDPVTNVTVARALYDSQGWTPWVCF